MQVNYKLSIFLCLVIYIGNSFGQNEKPYQIGTWKFDTEVLKLRKFQAGSTGLIVEKNRNIKIPTIFSLEIPNENRMKVDLDFEAVKRVWLKTHPSSDVIQIHYYPTFPNQSILFNREAFVWVISGDEILNVELVRKGACPANVMLLAATSEPYMLVPRYVYDHVRSRILEAEKAAKKEKLGMWKD